MTTATKIENHIHEFTPGKIFFSDDFISIGSSDAIRQTLARLTKDSSIIRIAQGMYCYPKIDNELGLGVILPSFDQIAEAIAERDHARVVPTGVYAQNILGLSTQVPMNAVYLTDGSARKVSLSNGRTITFKHTVPKNLSFKNRLAMLITFALKSIKNGNTENWQIEHIHKLLKNEKLEDVKSDLQLMPVWIRNIVLKAYE